MLRRQLDKVFVSPRGRPAALLALVGQFTALVGLPLPNVAGKDIASPFPCQQRQCGCMRAADCWNHCCCFSARERLAWAREHQTEVPDSLVEKARQPEGTEPSACCNIKTNLSRQQSPTAHILGFMARQCQGERTPWGAGEPAPLPHPAVTWVFEARPAGWCHPSAASAPSVNQVPLVPPPRG